MAAKNAQKTVQGMKDTTTEKASQATKTTKGMGQSAIDATKGTGQPKGMGQSAIDTTKGIGQSAMGMGQSAFDATKGMGQSAMGMGQSAMDATMGMGRSAMEATKGMGQSVMGTGQQGKEQTGSSLQQTWILNIYCSCNGCQEKVNRVLHDIDGVQTVTINAFKQTATVTGTVNSAEVLVEELWEDCRKYVEFCRVTQKNEGKTQSQHREQNSSKDVVGGKKEHTAMAEREMQRNKARTQNQHTQQNSGKDVGGDKKEHRALARREKQRKKPRDPKQQTEQKPGTNGGGNANDNAAVAQSNMQNKTLKTQKQQNSGQHEDNGQVHEDADALFTNRPRVFEMKELEAATNNFHSHNVIGEGGFGVVYKGTTHDEKEIAVKKLSTSEQGRKDFSNEKILAKFQHRNLVKLLGCCVRGSERLLVYEYFSNKSLDKFISDPDKRKELDWHKRYHIIEGIARGLSYLHEDSQVRLVHRDIKASNILLDKELVPKITDFGTARVLPEDGTDITTEIAGTFGYMAPEYPMDGQLSVKTDVYSFGIVSLELLTGRKIKIPSDAMKLLKWVWGSYKKGKVVKTIDSTIIRTCDKERASRCIQVALLCTQADSSRRPRMSEVFAMLSTSGTLPVPTNPPGSNVRRRKVNPVDGAM